jgi:hypothetical protein
LACRRQEKHKGLWRSTTRMERFFLSLKMERVWQRDDANPRQSHP